MTKLSTIGEFGLIERLTKLFKNTLPPNITGIGDDCSVVPLSDTEALLVSTDMLIEDCHFILNKISAFELGHKALAVNISDIAAMGGMPEHAYLSIGIPVNTDVEWLDEFFMGINSLAIKYNMHILGGDTTRTAQKLVINITVLGKAKLNNIKYRSAAKADDIICVTGILGDSAGGLQCILNNVPVNAYVKYLVNKHNVPYPHVMQGLWLAQHACVGAMMDVSDGPESDIQRIMKASGCGAIIDLNLLPISEQLQQLAVQQHWNAKEMALCGGEDYCLLFTINSNNFRELSELYKQQFGQAIYNIGTITNNTGVLTIIENGNEIQIKRHGYNHF